MTNEPSGGFQSEKELLLALIHIAQNLPALIDNYNYLLTLEDWNATQQDAFEKFVFHLVLIIRHLENSLTAATHHPTQLCLKVLKIFEEAIKSGTKIPVNVATEMNEMLYDGLSHWEIDFN